MRESAPKFAVMRAVSWLGRSPGRTAAALAFAVSAALLLGALGFQYIGELPPCPLCLEQRYPHVAVLALALLALVAPRPLRAGLLVLTAIAFAVTSAIGVYHAGVEYAWWAGPDTCTGTVGLDAQTTEDLLAALESAPVILCDVVVWELFGISMAGYNAIISFAMALFCLVAGRRTWRRS